MLNTIEEVYTWLYSQKKQTKRENLNRITFCLKELGVMPEYPIIHIAGTNGKGSTANYIKNILKHTGKRVGLFVSPYVISFNERIEINDRYISDAEILHYANILEVYAQAYFQKFNDVIPFFELTLLMAMLFYRDRSVDMAVIECGVGGLLDATNALPSTLAIITNVGYDHMNTLGNTLPEIATHKLGIVHEGMTCLTCVCDELKPQFIEYAIAHKAEMVFVDRAVADIKADTWTCFTYKEIPYRASLFAEYQAYNAALAIEAVQRIEPGIPQELIFAGLETTVWPGRMEIMQQNPLIILDGAHNLHGIDGLANTMEKIKNKRRLKVIFSALHDKAFDKMLNRLDDITDFYYFTKLEDTRATLPEEFTCFTKRPYAVIENAEECLRVAKESLQNKEILLVTGSLHFISVMRKCYLSLQDKA